MKKIIFITLFVLFIARDAWAQIALISSINTELNGPSSGIAWDGTSFWVSSQTGFLNRYDLNGSLLNTYDVSTYANNTDAGGLTSNGTSLWGIWRVNGPMDPTFSLFRFDLNADFVSVYSTSLERVKGLSWDGAQLRVLANGEFVTMDLEGNVQKKSSVDPLSATPSNGLAFYDDFLISSQLSTNTIYRYDSNTGNVLNSIPYGVGDPSYVDFTYLPESGLYLGNRNVGGNSGTVDVMEISWGEVPVPEPATMLLFAGGLTGAYLRRRQKRSA